jgi:hypothetical protein
MYKSDVFSLGIIFLSLASLIDSADVYNYHNYEVIFDI